MNIDKVRSSNGFMRTVATIVLVAYSNVVVSPGVQAMQQAEAQRTAQEQALTQERSNLGKALSSAKQELRVLADRPNALNRKPTREERRAAKEVLRTWRTQTNELIDQVRAEFANTGALIERKELPEVIRQRHADAVAKFEAEVAAFNTDVSDALATTDETVEKQKAEAAFRRLERSKLGRSQQEFDPNNLPNSTLKPDRTRTPKTTAEEFQAALLLSDTTIQLAQAGGFDFSQLTGADDPSYLEVTTEVVLTPDIQAKAEELNHNPVEIYNWVRNNVHWQPTWGAIQNASHTLSSQRGNAFDIASLTIALLRASGIPSRYVYGTIDVPEEKFRNWAGGFQHIEAAMDFASAGGIPVIAVTSGGRITKIRIEHIWVEAAIDFQPSRGVKNRSADSWVAIDPSFKQIEILDGVDEVEISGLQPAQLAQSFLGSGTLNEAEGWASGFNALIVQAAQQQAGEALEEHIEQNLSDATMGDVLGGRRILQVKTPLFAASLPNRTVTIGTRLASIPEPLQQQITFAFDEDVLGEPVSPRTFPWAELNGRRIALSFRAATQADLDALATLLPTGDVTDYHQLPTSIPAYLIRVIPELKVDGVVRMSGSPISLGQEINFVFNPRFVGTGVRPFSYKVAAGSYLAVAVFAGSISRRVLARAEASLAEVSAAVATPSDATASLSRDDLLGVQYHAGLLSYYSQYQSNADTLAKTSNGHFLLAAGVGTFGYEPHVDTFFGVPRSIGGGTTAFNVPIVNLIGESTGDQGLARTLTLQIGIMSSVLEHAVPEQIDSTAPAMSAAKAIQIAAAQGRPILAADQATLNTVLSQVSLDSAARAEIFAAVSGGKIALMHAGTVSVPGWVGSGYMIVDPLTGSGAYKISGGMNGGVQQVGDAMTIAAAGASGYLEGRTADYVGRDIWFSERLKYLSKIGKGAAALGYLGFAVQAYWIWTDDTLSTSQKVLKTCVNMLFFGISSYLTGAIAAATAAAGPLALGLGPALIAAIFVTVTLAFALLTLELVTSAGRATHRRREPLWA